MTDLFNEEPASYDTSRDLSEEEVAEEAEAADESENVDPDQKRTLYARAITEVFQRVFKIESDHLPFSKAMLEEVDRELNLHIKNIPDVPYAFRVGRYPIPDEIERTGNWIIEGRGKGRYGFTRLKRSPYITIPSELSITEIPEATPDVVLKYGGRDEQGMLTRIRYNRLVGTFLSLTDFHLQGHVRTSVPARLINKEDEERKMQVEVDDLYVGVDTEGKWYVIPVEAKSVGEGERLGVIQVQQMIAMARYHYPSLILRPVGVKPLEDGTLIFIEFDNKPGYEDIAVRRYARYKLIRDDRTT